MWAASVQRLVNGWVRLLVLHSAEKLTHGLGQNATAKLVFWVVRISVILRLVVSLSDPDSVPFLISVRLDSHLRHWISTATSLFIRFTRVIASVVLNDIVLSFVLTLHPGLLSCNALAIKSFF